LYHGFAKRTYGDYYFHQELPLVTAFFRCLRRKLSIFIVLVGMDVAAIQKNILKANSLLSF